MRRIRRSDESPGFYCSIIQLITTLHKRLQSACLYSHAFKLLKNSIIGKLPGIIANALVHNNESIDCLIYSTAKSVQILEVAPFPYFLTHVLNKRKSYADR